MTAKKPGTVGNSIRDARYTPDDLAQDSYNLRAQRRLSNFDIPHRFVLSSTWAFPIGRGRRFFNDAHPFILALISDWQVNSITTYQSGQPFTVTVGSFDSITQTSNRRPIQVSDPRQNIPGGFAFNPTAFVAPPPGQFGNVGRSTLRGDGFLNTDFGLLRDFRIAPLGESGVLQFRAETFNLYNQANFTFPVTTLSNNSFGRFVGNSTSPRVLQFALKLQF